MIQSQIESAHVIPAVSSDYVDRVQHRESSAHSALWDMLDQVKDPEIPVLSIWDLGVLQDVVVEDQAVTVVITPTYSGCPAMEEIKQDIRKTLSLAGYANATVAIRLSPAWSTDWMSPAGREQLKSYGIAPPLSPATTSPATTSPATTSPAATSPAATSPAVTSPAVTSVAATSVADTAPPCPRCGSASTALISEFGSTACKALFKCNDCLEPFDYFKCL